jgi:hypothetical protein
MTEREVREQDTTPEMKKFNASLERAMNLKVDVDSNEFLSNIGV